MEKINVNRIPDMIKNQELSTKQAVDLIATFVSLNYPVFGLHHFDEDFREEIILHIIERGESIIKKYNKLQGDFFNYLYCCIKSTTRTLIRTKAKKKIMESVVFSEQINNLEEKEYKYSHINYNCFDTPKVPYAQTKITPEELRTAFTNINKDKSILILAMKSSFYLTDQQINKICDYYNLNKKEFYKTIDYYRLSLMNKSIRKQTLLTRRNNAYYNHKKYEKQLEILKNCDFSEDKINLKNHLLNKNIKQYNNWLNLTTKLNNGLLSIRPSNKLIASILGICERQVIYHIKRAKKKINKELEELKENIK